MDKQNRYINTYTVELLRNRKEWNSDAYYNMGGLWKYAK